MIALILPTRKRPSNVRNFILYWKSTRPVKSRLFVLYDEDDEETHALVEEYKCLDKYVYWIRQPYMKTGEKINSALKHINQARFSIIGFVGDDIEIKNSYDYNWEHEIINALNSLGKYSMVHPDDFIQNGRLPTHPFVTKELINKIGWFAHPDFWHTKIDTVWRDIGEMLNDPAIDGGYKYLRHVKFEHFHPSVNTAQDDPLYQQAYSKEWTDHALKMLKRWNSIGKRSMKNLLLSEKRDKAGIIPLVILNFNQLTYTINLINWWNYYTNSAPVYIVDSASKWLPMQQFYDRLPFDNVKVIRHMENKGVAHLKEFVHTYIHKRYDYYVLSNPDICPHPATPENFMEVMKHCIDVLGYDHVGFGLKIDDIPNFYNKKREAVEWEKQWFKKPLIVQYGKYRYRAYHAPIDLTFALYKTANGGWTRHSNKAKWANSMRIFEAFHYGWYVPAHTRIEENKVYFNTARRREHHDHDLHGGVNHWIPNKK